jgi:uncharacterized protein YndB with AHSA1/START domain
MPTIERSVEIDAPPSVIWRVLTTRELVREWAAAVVEDIDIHTTWRVGAPVTWRAPGGGVVRQGVIADMTPERSLRFDYAETADGSFSQTVAITPDGRWTRVTAIMGPLSDAEFERLDPLTHAALVQIKSLAEELAGIESRRSD